MLRVFFILITLLAGHAATFNLVNVHSNTYSHDVPNSNAVINITRYYQVNPEADQRKYVDGIPWLEYPERITECGQELVINEIAGSGTVNAPLLTVSKAVGFKDASAKPPVLLIKISIENRGPGTSYHVVIQEDLTAGLEADFSSLEPDNGDVIGELKQFNWSIGTINENNISYLTFEAIPGKDGQLLPEWKSLYTSTLTYFASSTKEPNDEFKEIEVDICLHRKNNFKYSLFYQQGYTAMSFFIAVLFGVALVIIVVVIFLRLRKRNVTSPETSGFHLKGKKLLLDAKDALKKGFNTIKDFSLIAAEESIILLLVLKDKLQVFREIDSMDIVSTIQVDTDIEQQRNEATTDASVMLVHGMRHNKDIDQSTQIVVLGNFRKRKSGLEKALLDDYEKEKRKLYKKLSAKNRAKLNRMVNKHHREKKDFEENTADLPEKERKELENLMDQQQQTEQNEETYHLKLEQDEETEKLRKEFAIRKRMGLKELQGAMFDDIIKTQQLDEQKANWLIKEHKNTQEAVEKIYDEEISRQRMILEEKLARRKALAQSTKQQEEGNTEQLNTVAGHQVALIQKAKKQGVLDTSQANHMITEATQQLTAIKNKMERDRERQEAQLHQKLSDLKKQRLAEKNKEHAAALADFEKANKLQQTEGPVSPLSYVDGKLKILSQQREDLSMLENQIDAEHAEALYRDREIVVKTTKDEITLIEDKLIDNLKQQGMRDAQIKQLLDQHEREVEQLRSSHEHNRNQQKHHFQAQLAKNRQEWAKRYEAEKVEQQQLRDHESRVVSKLISSQVSMSDAERDRIMREHEKQMVKLENSLTLSKLRQKRLLEEKLAMKKAIQLEKLQQAQKSEIVNHKHTYDYDDDSGDESQKTKLNMMKKHAQQKIALMQGQKLDWDTEMESIRVEMMKERALSLKEQEEQLGAMVTSLQLSKATELSKIEEQQKAINNLKSNLMDDLNARGVLTDPDCQAIIERHKQEQDQLNDKLQDQRAKQEKMLKKQLMFRLDQREKSMVLQQETELKDILATAPNKTAAKIRQMLLIHKYMLATEQLRNQLDREITQTLEEVRQQHEVNRMLALQEQELQFIGGLVRVGSIPKEELITVLNMLLPGKNDQEKQVIYNKINAIKDSSEHEPITQSFSSSTTSSLTERIRTAQHDFLRRSSSRLSGSMMEQSSELSSGSHKMKKKQRQMLEMERHGMDNGFVDSQNLDYSHADPHHADSPFADSFPPGAENKQDDYWNTGHPPPSQLPPIKMARKKKKNKLLKKLAHPQDEQELL